MVTGRVVVVVPGHVRRLDVDYPAEDLSTVWAVDYLVGHGVEGTVVQYVVLRDDVLDHGAHSVRVVRVLIVSVEDGDVRHRDRHIDLRVRVGGYLRHQRCLSDDERRVQVEVVPDVVVRAPVRVPDQGLQHDRQYLPAKHYVHAVLRPLAGLRAPPGLLALMIAASYRRRAVIVVKCLKGTENGLGDGPVLRGRETLLLLRVRAQHHRLVAYGDVELLEVLHAEDRCAADRGRADRYPTLGIGLPYMNGPLLPVLLLVRSPGLPAKRRYRRDNQDP